MARILLLLAFFMILGMDVLAARTVSAFQGPGCMGECTDCHSLTKKEAGKLLKTEQFKAKIVDVKMGPIKGLWAVTLQQGNNNILVYIDFAKQYLVEGSRFTPLKNFGQPKPLDRVDLSIIPLNGALVFGDPKAPKKVIIFDDPDCGYCADLHVEIKKILKKRSDIVFYVKLFPLPIHPNAYAKSMSIVCSRSPKMLEDAFAGKKLPDPDCKTTEVDDNLRLGAKLGIHGTPGVILPDGRLNRGYVPAAVLEKLIDNKKE